MYGVPEDLDLSAFRNAVVERVDLGPYIIHVRFAAEPALVLEIEGDWELRGPGGGILDRQEDPARRECIRLHLLLGRRVIATELAPPESIALRFESGHVLRVFDHSKEYESFGIEPGGIHI